MRLTGWLWMALGWGWAVAGFAGMPVEHEQAIAKCHAVQDKIERVRCYDEATDREKYLRDQQDKQRADAVKAGQRVPLSSDKGILGELWGFDSPVTGMIVKQYQPNYIIAYNTNPFNSEPQTPGPPQGPNPLVYNNQPSTDPSGLNFQLSGKIRLFGPEDSAYSVWLAYTQQSWWQVFDAPNSRPFRESDYQPEAILALRPRLFSDNVPSAWRLLNFGYIHQSNGQSGAASRSWNRVYAEAAFEHDWDDSHQLALAARVWSRINEDPNDDDNPDITNYLGYGDLRAIYRQDGVLLTGMARGNFRTGKGAFQLGVAFPFVKSPSFPLKLYAQFFTGYGESLLDYNWRQTTFGIGLMLSDWP